jgi:hypothetical protein
MTTQGRREAYSPLFGGQVERLGEAPVCYAEEAVPPDARRDHRRVC